MTAQTILTELRASAFALSGDRTVICTLFLKTVYHPNRSKLCASRRPRPRFNRRNPPVDRARWTGFATLDPRSPLIPPEVRAKIESIETDARAKGWPAELLWNGGF